MWDRNGDGSEFSVITNIVSVSSTPRLVFQYDCYSQIPPPKRTHGLCFVETGDHVSFGADSLSGPVHSYIIGVRVNVLHNAACYVLVSLLL